MTAAAFIFQIKISSFTFLKSIVDDRNIITPINSTNLIFFKAIQHNMPQMLLSAIHIEQCRKMFQNRLCLQQNIFQKSSGMTEIDAIND